MKIRIETNPDLTATGVRALADTVARASRGRRPVVQKISSLLMLLAADRSGLPMLDARSRHMLVVRSIGDINPHRAIDYPGGVLELGDDEKWDDGVAMRVAQAAEAIAEFALSDDGACLSDVDREFAVRLASTLRDAAEAVLS